MILRIVSFQRGANHPGFKAIPTKCGFSGDAATEKRPGTREGDPALFPSGLCLI